MIVWETIIEKITGFIFGLICHQDFSILMKVDGREILLCPRCMGLHLGFLSSFIILALLTSNRIKIVARVTQLILAIAIGSMAIDWGLGGYLGLFTPTTFSRLATGLVCGTALSVLVTSYRRGMAMPLAPSNLNLTGFQVGSLICSSLCVGAAVVVLSSWMFLSSILLLSVIANASLAIHTVALILRSRLSQRAVVESLSNDKGGS